jgi:hypothetical protein
MSRPKQSCNSTNAQSVASSPEAQSQIRPRTGQIGRKRGTDERIDSTAHGLGCARSAKLGHVRVFNYPISLIKPSPENDQLYKPIDPDDPDIIALAESIKSGHRRYMAAKLAGVEEIPCLRESIYHDDPEFLPLLREYNLQREKSLDEKLREEIVSADPEEAYESLIEHRTAKAAISVRSIQISGQKRAARFHWQSGQCLLLLSRL